jgi:hypothetical protein
MDLFVVPTIGFSLLYAFVIDRRDLVRINVTTNPTSDWIARQMTEAFPGHGAPKYLIRDRYRNTLCHRWMPVRDGDHVPKRFAGAKFGDKPIELRRKWTRRRSVHAIYGCRRDDDK